MLAECSPEPPPHACMTQQTATSWLLVDQAADSGTAFRLAFARATCHACASSAIVAVDRLHKSDTNMSRRCALAQSRPLGPHRNSGQSPSKNGPDGGGRDGGSPAPHSACPRARLHSPPAAGRGRRGQRCARHCASSPHGAHRKALHPPVPTTSRRIPRGCQHCGRAARLFCAVCVVLAQRRCRHTFAGGL